MWDALEHHRIYLDTNIFIFAVEPGNPWTEMLRALFRLIDSGAVKAMTSELTLAEVLVKPLRFGTRNLIDTYEQILGSQGGLLTVPIDRMVLRAASQIEGRLRIKLLDAIHVATAEHHSCDIFLTNDKPLGVKLDVMKWISLPKVAEGNA